jgi:hypothetical protein
LTFEIGQMRLVGTTEGFAGTLSELPCAQHSVAPDDLAFAVDPHQIYGVEPQAWVDTKSGVCPE